MTLYVIDCEKKGNLVRFYLGNDPDYHGDRWDEDIYGLVYSNYIIGYKDIVFPFNYSVLTPDEANDPGYFFRYNFKNRDVPCVIACPNRDFFGCEHEGDFWRCLANAECQTFYFGDVMEPDEYVSL